MPPQRSINRILLNVALDGVLAALATPVAGWIADPDRGLLRPLWFVAGGAVTLLVAGLPFRLPQQYWRFVGLPDLAGVVGGSIASAALFALLLVGTGFPLPTPTFPIVHALTLMAALGLARVVYRLRQVRRGGREGAREAGAAGAQPVLLVGAGEGADLFLRALEYARGASAYRVIGLLALTGRQIGRRINGHGILGTLDQTGAVLQRLRGEELFKLPGVAETIDWAQALTYLSKAELTAGDVDETLGVLLKYQDDIAKIRGAEAARLLAEAKA